MKESEAQVKIARVATALAYTLYQRVTGKPYTGTVSASAHLVGYLLLYLNLLCQTRVVYENEQDLKIT